MTLSESIKFNNGKRADEDAFSKSIHGQTSKFLRLKAETFRNIGLNPYQNGNSEILSLIRLGDKVFHCN